MCVYSRSHIWTSSHCNFTPLSFQTCSGYVRVLDIIQNFSGPTPKSLPAWDQMRPSRVFLSRSLNNSRKDFSACFRSLSQSSFTHRLFKPSRIWYRKVFTEHFAAATTIQVGDMCCGGALHSVLTVSTILPVIRISMMGLVVFVTHRQVLMQRLSHVNCWSFKLHQICLGCREWCP